MTKKTFIGKNNKKLFFIKISLSTINLPPSFASKRSSLLFLCANGILLLQFTVVSFHSKCTTVFLLFFCEISSILQSLHSFFGKIQLIPLVDNLSIDENAHPNPFGNHCGTKHKLGRRTGSSQGKIVNEGRTRKEASNHKKDGSIGQAER